jgi:PAS domain S-box-containing protein
MKVIEPMDGMRTADGSFEVGPGQRIREWSAEAAEALGYEAEEVVGKSCFDVICGLDDASENICQQNCTVTRNARDGQPTSNFDLQSRRSDGKPVWLNVSTLLSEEEAGGPPSVIHLFRDITERRGFEGKARRAIAALADDEGTLQKQADGNLPLGEQGASPLSPREIEVLRVLAQGLPTQEIADNLGISRVTTRNHIAHILTKLGVQSRLQAILRATELKLI